MEQLRELSVRQLHNSLSDALSTVFYGQQAVAITRNGKPMAVMIHPEDFEKFQAWQAQQVEEMGENEQA